MTFEEMELDDVTVGEILKQTARSDALREAYIELNKAEQAGKTQKEMLEELEKLIQNNR